MQKAIPHTITKIMIEELDKRYVGHSFYLISLGIMKRIEEISKEIKTVLQNATTEKEDEKDKERDKVEAEACFNTCRY